MLEATKAAAPGLTLIFSHKGLEAVVDLDAWDDARCLQQAREGGAVSGVLMERLRKQTPLA